MYFQLLVGTHTEKGKTYSVKLENHPQTGARIVAENGRPILNSDIDLVAVFGADKFRRVSKAEFNAISSVNTSEEEVETAADTSKELQQAVKKGATAIAEPPGVDVKSKFPELSDYPTVDVYFKRGKGYFICEGGEIKTEEPLKRDEVVTWVETFMEG